MIISIRKSKYAVCKNGYFRLIRNNHEFQNNNDFIRCRSLNVHINKFYVSKNKYFYFRKQENLNTVTTFLDCLNKIKGNRLFIFFYDQLSRQCSKTIKPECSIQTYKYYYNINVPKTYPDDGLPYIYFVLNLFLIILIAFQNKYYPTTLYIILLLCTQVYIDILLNRIIQTNEQMA